MTTAPPHPAAAAADAWHLAGSLVALKAAVDAHWPGRDKRSDGGVGDAAHQAEGSASDHNPWLNNTVRAYDFTVTRPGVDGIDGPWFAEQLRRLGASGDVRLAGGPTTDDNGYVIFDGHITSPDFSRWVVYTGKDRHDRHVHLSTTRQPAGYEYSGPWEFLATSPLHPPAPDRAPDLASAGHRGPHVGNEASQAPYPDADPVVVEGGRFAPPGSDAVGSGAGYRAQVGNTGPAVARMQQALNDVFPLYSDLEVDGVYGGETAAVLEEFAHRIAVGDPGCPAGDREDLAHADGNDVGPKIAAAFIRMGVHV